MNISVKFQFIPLTASEEMILYIYNNFYFVFANFPAHRRTQLTPHSNTFEISQYFQDTIYTGCNAGLFLQSICKSVEIKDGIAFLTDCLGDTNLKYVCSL